jgi:hypothetical protein
MDDQLYTLCWKGLWPEAREAIPKARLDQIEYEDVS